MVVAGLLKPYKCQLCGEESPGRFPLGKKSICKTCDSKRRVRERKLSVAQQERQTKYYRQWYAERGRNRSPTYKDIIVLWQNSHQDSRKVAEIVGKAIQDGMLERPLICSMCSRETRVQAHHNDYALPFNIMWVCASCHKNIHLRKKDLTK